MDGDGWLCHQVALTPALLHPSLLTRRCLLGKGTGLLLVAPGLHLLAVQPPQKKTQHHFLRSSE